MATTARERGKGSGGKGVCVCVCGRSSGSLGAHSLSKHATVRRLPKNLASISRPRHSCTVAFAVSFLGVSESTTTTTTRTTTTTSSSSSTSTGKVHNTHTHTHMHRRGLCRLRFASFVHFSLNIAYLSPTVHCPSNSAWHFMHFSSFSINSRESEGERETMRVCASLTYTLLLLYLCFLIFLLNVSSARKLISSLIAFAFFAFRLLLHFFFLFFFSSSSPLLGVPLALKGAHRDLETIRAPQLAQPKWF